MAAAAHEPWRSATGRRARAVAERHGSCAAAATRADLRSLVTALQAEGQGGGESGALPVPQPAVPPSVAALWLEGAEWHFSRDHCDVFGCNIFPPARLPELTVQIFGDAENRADWQQQQRAAAGEPSVADPGWLVWASFSEYDYLFVCFDSASPHHGHVRHMVNNCCEERAVWNDALPLAERLLAWDAAGGDAPEDEEEESALTAMLSREARGR